MYTLKTELCFDAAHFLAGYKGKCSNIHGHRWRVVAEIKSSALSAEGQTRGMVVDFSTLKEDLKNKVDQFDHALIVEKNTLKSKTMEALREENFKIIEIDFRPTAENFAKFFFDEFCKMNYSISTVTVYETPSNCASYSAD